MEDLRDNHNLKINRYPIQKMYAIIDNCINADNEPMTKFGLMIKKQVCTCTLDKTELEII